MPSPPLPPYRGVLPVQVLVVCGGSQRRQPPPPPLPPLRLHLSTTRTREAPPYYDPPRPPPVPPRPRLSCPLRSQPSDPSNSIGGRWRLYRLSTHPDPTKFNCWDCRWSRTDHRHRRRPRTTMTMTMFGRSSTIGAVIALHPCPRDGSLFPPNAAVVAAAVTVPTMTTMTRDGNNIVCNVRITVGNSKTMVRVCTSHNNPCQPARHDQSPRIPHKYEQDCCGCGPIPIHTHGNKVNPSPFPSTHSWINGSISLDQPQSFNAICRMGSKFWVRICWI